VSVHVYERGKKKVSTGARSVRRQLSSAFLCEEKGRVLTYESEVSSPSSYQTCQLYVRMVMLGVLRPRRLSSGPKIHRTCVGASPTRPAVTSVHVCRARWASRLGLGLGTRGLQHGKPSLRGRRFRVRWHHTPHLTHSPTQKTVYALRRPAPPPAHRAVTGVELTSLSHV